MSKAALDWSAAAQGARITRCTARHCAPQPELPIVATQPLSLCRSPRVRFAGDEPSSAAATDAALADQATTAAAAGGDGGSAFGAAAAVPPAPERGIPSSASADVQRRRRLMYSKSGGVEN